MMNKYDLKKLEEFLEMHGVSVGYCSTIDVGCITFDWEDRHIELPLKQLIRHINIMRAFFEPIGIRIIEEAKGFRLCSSSFGTVLVKDVIEMRHHNDFDVFMRNPMFVFENPEDADYVCEKLEMCVEDYEFLSVNDVINIVEGFTGTDILFDEYCEEDADYYGWYSSEAFWTESSSGILHFESPKKLVSYEEEHKEIVIDKLVLPPKTLKAAAERIIEWRNKMDNRVRQSVEYVGTPRQSGMYPWPKNQVDCCGGYLPGIVGIDTYNDRVVIIRFFDGTFSKAVCAENDDFDLDTGISICLMKRMLDKDSKKATRKYNQMIADAKKAEESRQKARKKAKEAEKERKLKEQERQRKAKEKKARKQAEWRNNITEAIRPLMEHYEPDETDLDGGEE